MKPVLLLFILLASASGRAQSYSVDWSAVAGGGTSSGGVLCVDCAPFRRLSNCKFPIRNNQFCSIALSPVDTNKMYPSLDLT